MQHHDDHVHLGRHHDPGTGKRLFKSGRAGRHNGRPARTFHCNFVGVQVGTPGSRGGAIDYIAREGDYDGHQDLEHLAGDPDELKAAIAAINAGCRIRNGRIAERVAIATVLELPADADQAQRRQVAEALVAAWEGRGHRAIAAIHGAGEVQPHVHVLATARPVRRGADDWEVDRRPTSVPLRGKAAVRSARAEAAAIINEVCRPPVEFFPGRDREMDDPGIVGRKPKRRVPERAWHQVGQREPDPTQVAAARDQHNAEREGRRHAQRNREAAEKTLRLQRARQLVAGDGKRKKPLDAQVVGSRRLDAMRAAAAPKPLPPLSEKQRGWLVDSHQALGIDLPDLDTHEGRSEAFGAAKAFAALQERAKALRQADQAAQAPKPETPPSGPATARRRSSRGQGM